MTHYTLLFVLMIGVSCNSGTGENKHTNNNFPATTEGKKILDETCIFYKFENDTLKQSVEIVKQKSNSIVFILLTENKRNHKQARIEGEALLKGGDAEFDEDEDGNSYLVSEYIFEKQCWISLRLDSETRSKMKIIEADCIQKHDPSCPFSSVGFLLRH
jgi:hypothetical protein